MSEKYEPGLYWRRGGKFGDDVWRYDPSESIPHWYGEGGERRVRPPSGELERIPSLEELRAQEQDRQDMALLIRRLLYRLRNDPTAATLRTQTADYLKRKGLEGSLLRAVPTEFGGVVYTDDEPINEG